MKKVFSGIVLMAIGGGFGLSLESCTDPCDDAKRVSADFRTYNELYYWDRENNKVVEKTKIVEEDTFMVGNYVNFEASEQNAESYEWTIGSGPTKRTGKKVTLLFQDETVVQENPLPIKLKIKKAADSKCFPDDPGVDSVTHFIYFLSTWPVLGKYLGSDNTDPNKIFTVEILREKRPSYPFGETHWIANLPNGCNDKFANFSDGTAFEFVIGTFETPDFGTLHNCYFREFDKKIGHLISNRKTLIIEYEYTGKDQTDASLKKKIFTGIKQ